MRVIQKSDGSKCISVGRGECLTIDSGKFYINGEEIDIDEFASRKEGFDNVYNIHIEGTVDRIEVDQCENIVIAGNVNKVTSNCGNIKITGDVSGDVQTNLGDIECSRISGDIKANMGSIKCRRNLL